MDFKKLAAALALSAGAAHPMGHVSEGGKRGVPMRVNYGDLTEEWQAEPRSAGDAASIHGAGFKAQDDIARAIEEPESREAAYLANAILKGGYAAGIADKFSKMSSGGDIAGMEQASGNKATRALVGFSALMDLIKSQRPQQDWDISAGRVGFNEVPEDMTKPHGMASPDTDIPLADKHPAVGLIFRKRF